MTKKVTLKDLGAEFGVSAVTVSNALAGKTGVSETLRRKIRARAAELHMDAGKYSKSTEESPVVGVIVSERYISVGVSFYWEMYQALARAVQNAGGFPMLEILTRELERSADGLPRLYEGSGIDGLIVIGRIDSAFLHRAVSCAAVPIVLLDFYDPSYGCGAVLSANYMGMYRSTKYLLARGHRKIGFVGTGQTSDNVTERYFGYLKAMREYGISPERKWLLEERSVPEERIMLRLPEELPTAFACSSDYAAGFVYQALLARGLRVPEDVSLASYDHYEKYCALGSRLTTFHVDMDRMGQAAMDMLLAQLRTGRAFSGCRYIDSYMHEGSSVRVMNVD